MNSLTESEFLVLDELYFVSSYHDILEHINMDVAIFKTTLMSLLEKGFAVQMKYNVTHNDFEKLERPDQTCLEHSSFVATREGLLIHNSRS